MNFDSIEKIADAVLFEGYILYPYRASAIKNRQRWNFGTLYPRSYVESTAPHEASSFHAECLIQSNADTLLDARVRFLQLADPEPQTNENWSQGVVGSRTFESLPLSRLVEGFDQACDLCVLDEEEKQHAPSAYTPAPATGRLSIKAEPLREGLYRIAATFSNETARPSEAQQYAFISAHLLLHVRNAAFVSLLDPPPEFETEARQCAQRGVFPVLIGENGSRDRMLCSPIILYDYPHVAPESPGNFFDGCEMDEMLALRVLTLTDEEKEEIRRGDPHAQAILARTETLPEDHLLKLHGAVRDMHPVPTSGSVEDASGIQPWNPFDEPPPMQSIRIFGVEIRTGDRVRLWPQKKADILDMAMEGRIAIIEAIEQDLEGNLQLAVVLEDDPGRDMGMLRQPGHRFFFHPEEIEPLPQASSQPSTETVR